jgi:tetratricopeptide (TPR) repeat protein
LALSLNALANRLKTASGYDQAKAIRRRALDLHEKLVADSPANPEYRMALSTSYENLGNLLRQTGEFVDAVRAQQRAIELGEKLTADSPAVPGYRVHLAQVLTNLGITLKYKGQLAEAESAYRRALDVFQKLTADFPTIPDYQSGIGASLSNVAMLMNARDDLEEGGRFLRQAIEHQKAALERNPKSPTYRQFLRNHYHNLSDSASSDLNGDPLTFAWDANAAVTFTAASGATPTLTWAQLNALGIEDDGTYAILVRVSDGQGGVGLDSTTLTVLNTPPAVGPITQAVSTTLINSTIATRASFTDFSLLDTDTALWNWGDGFKSAGVITEANGSRSVTGTHVYAAGASTLSA